DDHGGPSAFLQFAYEGVQLVEQAPGTGVVRGGAASAICRCLAVAVVQGDGVVEQGLAFIGRFQPARPPLVQCIEIIPNGRTVETCQEGAGVGGNERCRQFAVVADLPQEILELAVVVQGGVCAE